MKWILAIFAALAIIGFFVFRPPNALPPQTTSTDTTSIAEESEGPRTNTTVPQDQISGYADYTPESFAMASDRKRVYFFHASWCPTCRPADAEFKNRISEIPTDTVVFKTDYDTSTELKRKYGITYQHTFVLVDRDENEITKWNGGGVDKLLTMVQ